MSPQLQSVIDELAKCETPDAVADLMRAAGAKGTPQSSCRCVIAAYARMRGVLLPDVQPELCKEEEPVIREGYEGYGGHEAQLPDAANEFALAFDNRLYPDLIA